MPRSDVQGKEEGCRYLDLISVKRDVPRLHVQGKEEEAPYHVTYPMMHVLYLLTLYPPPNRMTDACENITFPQLRLQILQINSSNSINSIKL